jgi:hypothetical protein
MRLIDTPQTLVDPHQDPDDVLRLCPGQAGPLDWGLRTHGRDTMV